MKQLRQYEMLREIGRGGMACVHEAVHLELGRHVAIKTMLPEVAKDERSVARFAREAKAACLVRHPHVVEIFDFGTADDVPFLVMELLEGETLRALLAREKPLAVEAALALLLPVATAVAHAHHLGIIHRDLKPANVFLVRGMGNRPWPKVLDFGISKRVDSALHSSWREGITSAEALVGTLAYMAPEQVQEASAASIASDQYALGVMLYELLTGRLPFYGPSPYQLMHNILHAPVARPSTLQTSLPKELDAIMLRALDRDPSRRYPSVHAWASQLVAFAGRDACTIWKCMLTGDGASSERTMDGLADAPRGFTQATAGKPRRRLVSLPHAALVAGFAASIALVGARWTSSRGAGSSVAAASEAIEPIRKSDILTSTAAANDSLSIREEEPTLGAEMATPLTPTRAAANPPVRAVPRMAALKESVRAAPSGSAAATPATKRNGVAAGTNDAPILE